MVLIFLEAVLKVVVAILMGLLVDLLVLLGVLILLVTFLRLLVLDLILPVLYMSRPAGELLKIKRNRDFLELQYLDHHFFGYFQEISS